MNNCLVIGGGLAGLFFAVKIADHRKVKVLSKEKVQEGNSLMAQGGVAAVVSREDSLEDHIRDTLIAGAGLCHPKIVEQVVHQGPERINDLKNYGVQFDRKGESYSLHKEGGHQYPRILHVDDLTGKAIHDQILKLALEHPNIEICENSFAIDLITARQSDPFFFDNDKCLGAYVLDTTSGEVRTELAEDTIIATGGAGKVYLYTSNWSGATGDGLAMAHRAGCRLANLEFMQFHPTCLYHPHTRNFLISEALRGEGAVLISDTGESFMDSYHALGSLAPRDIVARSIDNEMKKSGRESVYLDSTKISNLEKKFPAIFQRCFSLGINIQTEPIPVVPAAHYLCGGILTDLNGKTDLNGLYALGEAACTGLHGANRLASNSLLECLVYSHNCAEHLRGSENNENFDIEIPEWKYNFQQDEDELIVISHMWDEIRALMWNYVGIVRSNRRLHRAQSRLNNILSEFVEYYGNMRLNSDILELRNIALVADFTVKCALKRKESRGIHFNLDYPPKNEQQERPNNTILLEKDFGLLEF